MSVILKVDDLSKQYRLGVVGTGTLSHDLNRWWHLIRGKSDPYLKVSAVNDRSSSDNSKYVWALRDISFEVNKGEVLGIIGKNGAGKSTLLKILSRVTNPTLGEIKSNGRIASLLEVGTGFHPELTGRENIYLNGAILGMTKAEIKAKETEIIEFSGCKRYINTPVKRYSSGMRVRLAFAVAAHLEPDILVVDEVLAVGDAEFQKKAIGKMQDISKSDGRTVLFVSHNMAAVKSLCTRSLLLENGKVIFDGKVDECISAYLIGDKSSAKNNLADRTDRKGGDVFRFVGYQIENDKGEKTDYVLSGDDIKIRLFYKTTKEVTNVAARIQIKNQYDEVLSTLNNFHCDDPFPKVSGQGSFVCSVPKIPFFEGTYNLDFSCLQNLEILDHIVSAGELRIEEGDFHGTGRLPFDKKGILLKNKWLDERSV